VHSSIGTSCGFTSDVLRLEQTILRLTRSQVQLHDFEVVSQTEVVGLDVFSINTSNRTLDCTSVRVKRVRSTRQNWGFHAIVRQRNSQRTVCVTQTGGPCLTVQIVSVESA